MALAPGIFKYHQGKNQPNEAMLGASFLDCDLVPPVQTLPSIYFQLL
jgi:hypothetical protein